MPSSVTIDVELTEILTPSICSHLAVEFFKHIAYQRQQLPFPHKQLKSVLSKCDNSLASTGIRTYESVQAENEYRKVKGIFETMQATFKDLEDELCFEGGKVVEVVMILGATPLSPRDVYRVQFPYLVYGHVDSKHPHQNSLLQLFRCLISSEDLHSLFKEPLSPTNMFLFLKKNNSIMATHGFKPRERYSIPKSGKHAIIRFIPPTVLPTCICGGRNIFRDLDDKKSDLMPDSYQLVPEQVASQWFQAHQTIKGFKDVKINGVSASTVWLQSK